MHYLASLKSEYLYIITPYNRLFWRQITLLKTDRVRFFKERISEDFLFPITKEQIYGLLLLMEKMFDG